MRLFGLELKNIFIPPTLRGGNGGVAELSLKQHLLGDKSGGVIGAIPYYTQILVTLAAVITFFYIIIAGYQMLTAFGDESKYAQGKKTLQFAVVGFIISISALVIIRFVITALGYSGELPTT